MVQTTTSVAMACALLEIATDSGCAGWLDISGSSNQLTGTEQTRISGETYSFDGDGPIIQGGKREPMELVVQTVYTETALEAFEAARAAFEMTGCGMRMCLRWSPNGGAIGDALYTTPRGILTSFTYPQIDATAGGPILAGFTLKVSGITHSVVAT